MKNNGRFQDRLAAILAIVTLTVSGGCIQQKSEFTLNPDGRGMVVHQYTTTPMQMPMPMPMPMAPGPGSNPKEDIKRSTLKTLKDSAGVEAWKDVAYNLGDKGTANFKGTAFFSDFNKLKLRVGDAASESTLSLERNKQGDMILEFKTKKPQMSPQMPRPPMPRNLSDQQIKQMVPQAKMQYIQNKWMLQQLLRDYKFEIIFNLPGRIKEISGFQKLGPRKIGIKMEGEKMFNAMDDLMEDDEFLAQQIRLGRNLPNDMPDEIINEKLFGTKEPPRVVISLDGKDAFDYNSEMMLARAGYENMLKEIGLKESAKRPDTAAEFTGIMEFDGRRPEALNGFTTPRQKSSQTTDPEIITAPDYKQPVSLQLRHGLMQEKKGDLSGAMKTYFAIAANEKADERYVAQAYYKLGKCYLQKGNTDQAIKYLVHLVTHFPRQRLVALRAEIATAFQFQRSRIGAKIDFM